MLPPLRERREDIPVLAHHFLQRFAKEVKKTLSEISGEALGKLSAYDWPGNVRELANVIERAVVLGRGPEIAPHDLPARIVAAQSEFQSDGISYRDAMDAYRRQLVMRALAQTQGNRAAAARALGLHEKYFLRLLKSLRIAE
jgi:DNA-binding NtrC family response regulator